MKNVKTDGLMNIEIIAVPVTKLADTIVERGITVDKLAGIFLDHTNNVVHLAVVNGTLDVVTKSNLFIPGNNLPVLMTWSKIKDVYPFEIDGKGRKIDLVAWQKVIDQLTVLKDKYGRSAVGFYGAGYGNATTEQFVAMGNKIFPLATQGPRVTSLRYDEKHGYIYGLGLNDKFFGTRIVGVKADDFIRNPAILRDITKWDVIDIKVEPVIISLSRIRYTDGLTSFVVNHPDSVRRMLTVGKANGLFTTTWSDAYRTPFTVIGTVTNTEDLFVGYRESDDKIEIFLHKISDKTMPLFLA